MPIQRHSEETWTGTLTAVNAREKTFKAEHLLFTKTFSLGEQCAISTLDNQKAALSDLRPGEKVKVRYQAVEGVLVADQVAERPLHYTGTVQAIDPMARTVTMEEPPLYQPFHAPKAFQVATDCKIVLRSGNTGTLAALQPGDRISVIYELPSGSPAAYRIRDKSSTFVATLQAIDPSARTIEAKDLSNQKQFDIAHHCRIILSGEKAGKLKDLALGHEYRFTYEPVNGVNVLDRVTSVQGAKPAETAAAK